VPLVESGYQNLPAPTAAELADGSRFDCAGLWQFIPATARRYGMRVDRQAGVDERTDIEKETDAAARLLRDLHADLGDWGLALAAYNQGAKHVEQAIAAEGTRDPWELIRRGALNRYAAEVMAAAIVLADPSLVGEE
jgi:membrane-bound lytic murein transglycosylase D